MRELPLFIREILSPEQVQQLLLFEELIREINTRLNLISRRDIDWVWEHHIVPSLLFLAWWRLPAKVRVLDLGTGGGFPGIPLAIAHPDTPFLLLDSTRKKVEGVREMVAQLGLSDRVEVRWGRAEECRERFLIVVGRAVAPLPRFLGWVRRLLLPEGEVYYYTGMPWGPLPAGWQAAFHAFRDVLLDEPYVAAKGILHLRFSSSLPDHKNRQSNPPERR
ncbi:MAG: 16S rRNA (guanine(527)-N(7))-methyltransferase RsmG [Bacteroidia bacterium]|nr:16S rRNA (guanine(527)-N(7))-methyltransferase RsmG [Bacteroidia bacterium]